MLIRTWACVLEKYVRSDIGHIYIYIRPVRRILKRGVQSTAWPLGHGEGEGAGSFHTNG